MEGRALIVNQCLCIVCEVDKVCEVILVLAAWRSTGIDHVPLTVGDDESAFFADSGSTLRDRAASVGIAAAMAIHRIFLVGSQFSR
ncbi:hypothetical protein Y032_0154g2977 [Ancylostoma ceylanicum]|uniref:Uncharacterized protein n=1 Tax=Ancylostoma ceylanicum TaxID=53326 RepID=A0A016SZW8_9BILA|nr:hypothetical protein Y032_0154g2977 [Ancylostoma ceylanicum]